MCVVSALLRCRCVQLLRGEVDFGPKLELFNIEAPNYKELEYVEQEMEKLNQLWEIRAEWEKDRLAPNSLSLYACLSPSARTDCAK